MLSCANRDRSNVLIAWAIYSSMALSLPVAPTTKSLGRIASVNSTDRALIARKVVIALPPRAGVVSRLGAGRQLLAVPRPVAIDVTLALRPPVALVAMSAIIGMNQTMTATIRRPVAAPGVVPVPSPRIGLSVAPAGRRSRPLFVDNVVAVAVTPRRTAAAIRAPSVVPSTPVVAVPAVARRIPMIVSTGVPQNPAPGLVVARLSPSRGALSLVAGALTSCRLGRARRVRIARGLTPVLLLGGLWCFLGLSSAPARRRRELGG